MKRKMLPALFLSLGLLAGCAAGNGPAPEKSPSPGETSPAERGPAVTPAPLASPVETMPCRIVDGAEEGRLVLAGEGESAVYLLTLGDLPVTLDGVSAAAEDLRDGMRVEVAYSGLIQETFPAALSEPTALHAYTQGRDDRCGLYLQVLEDLWTVDSGLNDDITQLGVDLSGVTDLTGAEKSAVTYVFGMAHDIMPVTGTLEELRDEGYLTPNSPSGDGQPDSLAHYYWEDGCFFTVSGESVSFNAHKWRSGLGAYFFSECTGAERDGVWSYEVGQEAIS